VFTVSDILSFGPVTDGLYRLELLSLTYEVATKETNDRSY